MASYPYNATAIRKGETIFVTADNGKEVSFGSSSLYVNRKGKSYFNQVVKNLRGGQLRQGESRRCHLTTA